RRSLQVAARVVTRDGLVVTRRAVPIQIEGALHPTRVVRRKRRVTADPVAVGVDEREVVALLTGLGGAAWVCGRRYRRRTRNGWRRARSYRRLDARCSARSYGRLDARCSARSYGRLNAWRQRSTRWGITR